MENAANKFNRPPENPDNQESLDKKKQQAQFTAEQQKIVAELSKEKQGFLDLFKDDSAEDKEQAQKWWDKKANNPMEALKLKQDLASWVGAKKQANEVKKKVGKLPVANDKITDIWNDKTIKPQEKVRQLDALYKAYEAHQKAESQIKQAKLAPKRKEMLLKQLNGLWESEEPADLKNAIETEIDGALNEHGKRGERIIEERDGLDKMLEEKIGDIGLFSKAEIKAMKKDWSKKMFQPFYKGEKAFTDDEDLIFKKMAETEKGLKKEVTERKKDVTEFVGIRKVFGKLQKKKAEGENDLAFGDLISKKKFEKSDKKARKEMLTGVVDTATDHQFESPYGRVQTVRANTPLKAFQEAMDLGQWQEKEETRFMKKEMPALENKGLAMQDWSDAHGFYLEQTEKLEGFRTADSEIVQEWIGKFDDYARICEKEMTTDVNTLEKQDEYTDQDKEKISHWLKNADNLKGRNDILAQKLKNLAKKMELVDEELNEQEAKEQEFLDQDVINIIDEAGAITDWLGLTALATQKEYEEKEGDLGDISEKRGIEDIQRDAIEDIAKEKNEEDKLPDAEEEWEDPEDIFEDPNILINQSQQELSAQATTEEIATGENEMTTEQLMEKEEWIKEAKEEHDAYDEIGFDFVKTTKSGTVIVDMADHKRKKGLKSDLDAGAVLLTAAKDGIDGGDRISVIDSGSNTTNFKELEQGAEKNITEAVLKHATKTVPGIQKETEGKLRNKLGDHLHGIKDSASSRADAAKRYFNG